MNLSIKEKFDGLLFGYAIGDALGLGTEFMTKEVVKARYPEGLHDYSQIIRDAHRSQWKPGEWSNDTETILMELQSIIDNKGVDFIDFAHRLKEWFLTDPRDITMNLRITLSQPEYSSKPFESARHAWTGRIHFDATSECLGRAMIASIWASENVRENVLKICRMTHPESRCEASCVVLGKMANSLFWKGREASFEELVAMAKAYNKDVVRYIEIARHGSLSDFELDDEDTLWFVRKALGAALWALWHCDSVKEGLYSIIAQGGDADTNACISGGLLGIKYGFSSIPENLVMGLVGKERLLNISDRFTKLLTEKFC